jgi:hypothetical protein
MRLPVYANPKGTSLSRYIAALVMTRNIVDAARYAERWPDSPAVKLAFAKAVSEQTTADGLTEFGISSELFELYRSTSIVGQLSGRMRPTPFMIQVPRELDSGVVSQWIPESNEKPVRAFSFDQVGLQPYKTGTIVVLSKLLAQFSKPSAEQVIRTILVNGIAAFIDAEFLGDAAPVIAESPGGICYNQETHGSTGATEAQIRADLAAMGALLESWRYPVWVCRPKSFMHMASLGIIDFLPAGPLLCGFPIIWTNASPAQLALIDFGSVLLADDGKSDIMVSEHSMVKMDDGNSPSSAQDVSLWQSNLVGIRCERFISWQPGTADIMAVKMTVTY